MLATNEYFSVGGGFVVSPITTHCPSQDLYTTGIWADGNQVNSETQTAENLYYRDLNPQNATPARRDQTHGLSDEDLPVSTSTTRGEKRGKSGESGEEKERSGQPRYLFSTAGELNRLCEEMDFTIAQVVWENELAFRSAEEIKRSLMESESIPLQAHTS